MSVLEFAKVWEQMEDSEKSSFVDIVGEYLEKYAEVTSSAGRLGRTEGVDSRDLIEAFDFSCRRIKGETK